MHSLKITGLTAIGLAFGLIASLAWGQVNREPDAQEILGLLQIADTRIRIRVQNGPPLTEEEKAAELAKATELKREVARVGTPRQIQSAINILGVIHLRLEMPKRALEIMQEMDLNSVDPAGRYVYEYNLGRAFERNDQPEKAFNLYVQVIADQPEFAPAVDGAIRVLSGPSRAAVPEMGPKRLLALLVRHYADSRLDRSRFEKYEWSKLQSMADRSPLWKESIEEIRKAYQGELTPNSDPSQAASMFPAWSHGDEQPQAFSRLLLEIGDSLERQPLKGTDKRADAQAAQALAYYITAWGLDQSNTTAALRAAVILDNYPRLTHREQFLLALASRSANKNIAVRDESLQEFSLFHLTIGNILSGNQHCGSQTDPSTPFYHYHQALLAEKRWRESASFSASPELNQHLKGCDRQSGDTVSASPQLNRRLADCYRQSGDMASSRKFDKSVACSLKLYRPLSPVEDKLHYHVRAMVYPGGLLKSTVQAGLLLALDTPEKWGQGAAGFGRRLASSHATRVVRHVSAFGIDSALHEDPHFIPAPHRQMGARFWFAVKQTLVCRSDRLSQRFATWRVVSAYGAEFISNTWRPRGSGLGNDNIRGAFLRGSFTLAGDTASNLLREFLPYRGRWAKALAPFLNR